MNTPTQVPTCLLCMIPRANHIGKLKMYQKTKHDETNFAIN